MIRHALMASALALILGAGAAHAVGDHWISPTGSASWAAATSSSTPASLATANANAGPSDRVHMLPGTYTGNIAPVGGGSSTNRCVWMGADGDSSSVIINGSIVMPTGAGYHTLKWMRVTGGATIKGLSTSVFPSSDSLYFVRIVGGITFDGSDRLTVANCLVGKGGVTGPSLACETIPPSTAVAAFAHDVTIHDCVMYLGGWTTPAGNNALKIAGLRRGSVQRNRFYLYANTTDGSCTPSEFNRMSDVAWYDNKTVVRNYSAGAGGPLYARFLRDSTRFITFLRDTVIEDPANLSPYRISLTASGSYTNQRANYSNTFDQCYYRVSNVIKCQTGAVRCRFTNSIFDGKSLGQGTPFIGGNTDSATIRHNTFIFRADSSYAWDQGPSYPLVSVNVKSNIFWHILPLEQKDLFVRPFATLKFTSGAIDSNLYWSGAPVYDSTRTINTGAFGTNYRVGPSGTLCSGQGIECRSRYGDPGLAGYLSGDYSPSSTGNAVGGWWPDGYVGALNVASADTCLDALRPGRVTNFASGGTTRSTVSATWIEPGSDQNSGDDTGTTFEVRWSTAPITTVGEWDAAGTATTGTLGTPGAARSQVVQSGLALGVTRYYAIRYTDGYDSLACLSNTFSATTVDAVPPGTISDAQVKATTGTTATLSWTAPGDDGGTGTASSYLVRYRLTSPILSESDWSASTSASGVPTPSVAGAAEQMTISGLTSDRTYYFAVRALDPSGNLSAISNSPSGVTLDITAPGQITTLVSTGATATTISLRWTAVGDDGSTGTATTTAGRYTTTGPITNEVAWAAAAAIPGMPAPQASGTVQSVTVSGLSSGQTYHFAVRSVDEAGNVGAISNSLSRSTIATDVLRPAAPSITASAWPGVADGVRVTFSAVGDDSLTGTATSYALRYRFDAGLSTIGSSLWDAQSLTSRTYRVATTPTPRAAGAPDTIFVRGMRPGAVLWFALKAADEIGQESAVSNVDSVAIPTRPAIEYAQPARWLYQGAGPGSVPPAYPYVTLDGTAIDTAACRAASLFDGSSFCPEFADSAGTFGARLPLAALQTMRAMNPSFIIAGEPVMNAVYIRVPSDSALRFDYRYQAWRAARIAGGGWTTGSGAPGGSWTPGGYTDSTGTRWLLWTNVPGFKGWLYQTYQIGKDRGASSAGIPGLSNWNLNIAWQPTPGSFPVADSVADVTIRHFVTRTNPDGSWTYDECRFDLSGMDASFSALTYENIDHVRAGYATKAAFDSAWTFAAARIFERVRRAAIDAGRPDFRITGNGGSSRAYDTGNGWMNEGFPTQQGGTWFSNMYWVVGGMMRDRLRHAWTPYSGVTFSFACLEALCDTNFVHPDTAATRKILRFGLGTAALAGGLHAIGPAPASGPRGGAYMTWGFDEYAVDTVTSVALKGRAGSGWFTSSTSPVYYTAPTIYAGGDRVQGRGSFETSSVSSWWATSVSAPSGQGAISTVTDTVDAGSRSLRLFVGTKQDADWRVSLNPAVFGYATVGQTFVVTFRARTERACALQVHVVNKAFAERASWANGSSITIEPGGWNTYRIVGTCTATDSVGPSIWAAVDSSALVYVDGLTFHVGGARGGSAVREFRRGVVVVNPQAYADTVTFGRAVRRITAAPGRPADVNTGELIAAGSPIIVPSQDARFLLFPLDSLRPSRVADLVAGSPTSSSGRLTWTSPGNDSASGAALVYQIRQAATPIVSEANWNAAAVVGGAPTPLVAGTVQTLTVTGLSPSTTYYYALRAYDAAGYIGAISNSDSVVTLGVGTAPTAAFIVDHSSGAEPLTVACSDASTGGPTAWEWYARRISDESDPQISSDENPSFIFSNGGAYLITLQVTNAYGSDTATAVVNVACTNPSPILTISASAVNTTSISVVYKEPGDDGDDGAAALIEVRYVEGSTFTSGQWNTATPVSGVPIPTFGGTSAGVVVSGLLPGKTYAFAAKATDSGGCVGAFGAVAVASTFSGYDRAVGVTVGFGRVKVRVGGRR